MKFFYIPFWTTFIMLPCNVYLRLLLSCANVYMLCIWCFHSSCVGFYWITPFFIYLGLWSALEYDSWRCWRNRYNCRDWWWNLWGDCPGMPISFVLLSSLHFFVTPVGNISLCKWYRKQLVLMYFQSRHFWQFLSYSTFLKRVSRNVSAYIYVAKKWS